LKREGRKVSFQAFFGCKAGRTRRGSNEDEQFNHQIPGPEGTGQRYWRGAANAQWLTESFSTRGATVSAKKGPLSPNRGVIKGEGVESEGRELN